MKLFPKLPYELFEEFYRANPGMSVEELANECDVSPRTIYAKLKKFNRLHGEPSKVNVGKMMIESYKDGFDNGLMQGLLLGAVGGELLGEYLKGQNISLTDKVKEIMGNIMKKSEGTHGTQS